MPLVVHCFFQAEDGIRDGHVTGVQTCALPISDQRQVGGGVLAFAWILAIFTAFYMLPWAIAATRGKSNHSSVGLINFLLGRSEERRVGKVLSLSLSSYALIELVSYMIACLLHI